MVTSYRPMVPLGLKRYSAHTMHSEGGVLVIVHSHSPTDTVCHSNQVLPTPPAAGTTASTDINDAVG